MKQQGLSQISFTQPIRQIVSMLLACILLAAGLATAVRRLAQGMEAESGQVAALNRLVAGQDKIIAALSASETASQGYSDAESRMRLRSIDVQLLRILEELSAGRQETVADLRGDLAALSTAIKALARGTTGRG